MRIGLDYRATSVASCPAERLGVHVAILTAFLDSSDYSVLAEPRGRSAPLERVRGELIAQATSGRVRFAFSGTNLSEMAPTDPAYTPSAVDRAEVLVALCGRTALISLDRLLEGEATRLIDEAAPEVEAVSLDGTWFPELKDFVGPAQALDEIREAALKAATTSGASKAAQRQVMRQMFRRSGQIRPAVLKRLVQQIDLTELLDRYAMRPEHIRIIFQYLLGKASAAQTEAAFLESLREPKWMMRWFAQHHDQVSPLVTWVRGTSETFVAGLETAISRARVAAGLSSAAQDDLLNREKWRDLESRILLQSANQMLAHWYPDAPPCTDVERVERRCLGLTVMVRTLLGVLRDSVTSEPRGLKKSDFVDALHAVYAPYVDVFRADRYMAPHIARHTQSIGTTVVPRLDDLPAAIEARLRG